jgi:hypothetical protein
MRYPASACEAMRRRLTAALAQPEHARARAGLCSRLLAAMPEALWRPFKTSLPGSLHPAGAHTSQSKPTYRGKSAERCRVRILDATAQAACTILARACRKTLDPQL